MMLKYKKKVIICLLPILITILLLGCISQEATEVEERVEEKTLVIGTTMPIKSSNIFSDYYFSVLALLLTHRGLISLDSNGNFTPALAYKWETEDGRIWKFYIVRNATWHDGTPVTAEDIKFTIEYYRDKIPVYKVHWGKIKNVYCEDKYTLVIELEKPNANFLVNLLPMRAIPKHVFEKVEDPMKYDGEDRNIGCGPFIFEKFDPSAGIIVYKVNPHYYGKKPNIDKIIIKIYKNVDTMVMALRKGEIDTIYFYARGLDHVYVPQLLQAGNIKFIFAPNLGVGGVLFLNNGIFPYNITEFRYAMSYAINYEEIIKIITAGYGKVPNAGFVPEGWKYFIETRKMEYNPEKAKELLDKLGFVDIDNDGVREVDGNDLTINIIVRVDIPANLRLAELIKKDLEEIGLKVNIKPVDLATFKTIIDEKRSHEVAISRTTAWGMMMWAGYGSGYIDARHIGWANVTDPEFYEIVDKLLISVDESERKLYAHKIQQYYAEKLPVIPLYWDVHIQPYRENIEGLIFHPLSGILNDETYHNIKIGN